MSKGGRVTFFARGAICTAQSNPKPEQPIIPACLVPAAGDNDPAIIAILARAERVATPSSCSANTATESPSRAASYKNWLASLIQDCFVLDINEPTVHRHV